MQDFFAAVEAREHPWPAGRRDLHWHLLPPSVEQARKLLLDDFGELLRAPGLEAVPPRWLHTTVLHSGPRDSVTDQEIDAIVQEVREATAGEQPVELVFDRPTIGTVAISRPGRPGEAARRLWEATWRATQRVVGDRWPLIPEVYHPHITIAYAGSAASAADRAVLKAELSDTTGEAATLVFPALTLVEQWHTHHRIVWQPLATVPLGTPPAGL